MRPGKPRRIDPVLNRTAHDVETASTDTSIIAVSAAISFVYVAHASAHHEQLDDWPFIRWVSVPTISAAYGFDVIVVLLGSLAVNAYGIPPNGVGLAMRLAGGQPESVQVSVNHTSFTSAPISIT